VPFEGRCLAAVLACGENAVLSHRSAAELWGFMPRAKGPVHVTVPASSGRRSRPGIIVHRSRHLAPEHSAFHAGVRVTTPRRTLADLRPALDRDLRDRATRKALDLGLISRRDVERETALTRSELERSFLALCRRHRLPKPLVNARIGPYEVDFLWPEQRLVVETDGFEHHGTREAFEQDRARDADLQARGYRVLRTTHRQIRDEARRVADRVRRLLTAPAASR
jgi:very-short-patch-repair endonuclease